MIAHYRTVWIVDFEFTHNPTGRPDVICLAACELHSGRRISYWRDQLGSEAPYDIGADALMVVYSGSEAELACHLALGWPLPENVVDLIVEYRMTINGRAGDQKLSLLEALARFDIAPRVSPAEKREAQLRAAEGWPFSPAEREWLLSYCRGDVEEEAGLLAALGPAATSPLAVWRGQYIKAIARAWWRGVPIDPVFTKLATNHLERLELRQRIINDIRPDFPDVFDSDGVLKNAQLASWMQQQGIPVPRTPTGRAATSVEQLAMLARDYPALEPFNEAVRTLAQLKDFSLPIGGDDRLRAWFAPFLTITSRSAPPTNGYIYSLPAWMRATMQPPEGRSLAYLDWQAMEFGLAAAISGDARMIEFYESGDPYLATAVAAGSIPSDATKQSHADDRTVFKIGLLSVQYGIGPHSLARRMKRPVLFARRFIDMHHELFPEYWRWSDGVVAQAIHIGRLLSRHGWHYAVQPPFNYRSLRNWPIQTAGADILRCAVILADRLGVEMLATAHDAVLIESATAQLDAATGDMAWAMTKAAEILTGGFRLRVDIDIRHHGERFLEQRGRRTFAVVDNFVQEKSRNAAA